MIHGMKAMLTQQRLNYGSCPNESQRRYYCVLFSVAKLGLSGALLLRPRRRYGADEPLVGVHVVGTAPPEKTRRFHSDAAHNLDR